MAAKTMPKTKYDGFLGQTAVVEAGPEEHFSQPAAAAPAKRATVKALAKSKDPNMKGYTLLLNRDTHADASHILKKKKIGEDMSDLTQRLLADWVRGNQTTI